MIGSLRGSVLERHPSGEAVLEVGGVGYRVLVPLGACRCISIRARPPSCSRTCTCARTR